MGFLKNSDPDPDLRRLALVLLPVLLNKTLLPLILESSLTGKVTGTPSEAVVPVAMVGDNQNELGWGRFRTEQWWDRLMDLAQEIAERASVT